MKQDFLVVALTLSIANSVALPVIFFEQYDFRIGLLVFTSLANVVLLTTVLFKKSKLKDKKQIAESTIDFMYAHTTAIDKEMIDQWNKWKAAYLKQFEQTDTDVVQSESK